MEHLFWIESWIAIFMLGAAFSFLFSMVFNKQLSKQDLVSCRKPLSPQFLNRGSISSFRQLSLFQWPPGQIEPFEKGRLCLKVF